MQRQPIKKNIDIQASPEKVWKVLLDDAFNRTWYQHFSEGSHAITTWEEGSKAIFKDNSGMGMISKVISNKPYALLAVEYTGILTPAGEEDYDSKNAQNVKGGQETYTLTSDNSTTHLAISSDMDEAYFDQMSAAWDKALASIKSLAESL